MIRRRDRGRAVPGTTVYVTLMVGKGGTSRRPTTSARSVPPKSLVAAPAGVRPLLRLPRGGSHQPAPSQPAVLCDNHVVATPDQYPDGYYFTDDITDRAISR